MIRCGLHGRIEQMPRRRKFGFSFSWRRASGLSATKGRLSRKLGIPLSRSGRQRKVGRAMGCCIPMAFILASIITAAAVARWIL
jgi:hypothetical protein